MRFNNKNIFNLNLKIPILENLNMSYSFEKITKVSPLIKKVINYNRDIRKIKDSKFKKYYQGFNINIVLQNININSNVLKNFIKEYFETALGCTTEVFIKFFGKKKIIEKNTDKINKVIGKYSTDENCYQLFGDNPFHYDLIYYKLFGTNPFQKGINLLINKKD